MSGLRRQESGTYSYTHLVTKEGWKEATALSLITYTTGRVRLYKRVEQTRFVLALVQVDME